MEGAEGALAAFDLAEVVLALLVDLLALDLGLLGRLGREVFELKVGVAGRDGGLG